MSIETHNWSSSAHQELHKIEAAKFVRDFKSLANEADASLAKHKALELEIKRLLKAVVSQDIMIIVQNKYVVDTSDLKTKLEPYKDMQQKIERLQAQLGDLKGKSKDISSVSDTRYPLSQKLENENVELEFRVLNYARENDHLKATNKNQFDSISVSLTSNSVSTPQDSKSVNNDKNQKAKVSIKEIQKKYQPKVSKPKKEGTRESLATPKPRKSRLLLRWSPTSRMFNQECKIVDSSESKSKSDCYNGDNACTSNILEPKIKRFPNSTSLLDRVYFIEGLGHNLFSVGQFCDSDLEVAFRRNACFVRNLEGVDLLKGDHSTNLYTINLHEIASASPICLMARASSTKSWLWHQRLSHLNFDAINDLARNDLVAGLPKFKYHKEHLCPSCEQGKIKRASHPPKLNDRKDIGKLDAKGDIGFFIGYSVDSYAYRVYNHRTKKIMETMNDVDKLNPNSMVDANTFFNPFANSSTSVASSSSSQNVDPSNMHTFYQPYPYEFQWTKDHPLEQVIGEPSRPVLTRNQLRSDGDMCMYALTVSTMKPKNVKEAMTDPAWIDSMQEELL
nr:integrase, catalytic region, zinc finger, CCHC-type, peptidase aspartic, catalytic [Tanacetum cinerariifolium]